MQKKAISLININIRKRKSTYDIILFFMSYVEWFNIPNQSQYRKQLDLVETRFITTSIVKSFSFIIKDSLYNFHAINIYH